MSCGRAVPEVGHQRTCRFIDWGTLGGIVGQKIGRLSFVGLRPRTGFIGVVRAAVGETTAGAEKIVFGGIAFGKFHVNAAQATVVVFVAGRVAEGVIVGARLGGLGERMCQVVGAVKGAAAGGDGDVTL